MQFLTEAKQKAADFAEANAAALLTAGGVVGTVATAVLAGRAGYKASQILAEAQLTKMEKLGKEAIARGDDEPTELPDLTKTEKIVLVGPHFLPPVVTGTATVSAIIFANRVSANKAAALAAAYGLAERNLSEYKEKVQEKLTGPKKQAIDDELAQDAVNQTPGHNLIVVAEGEVLCFDKPTGRWFRSSMETIKQAVNSTNAEIIHHDHANASFFYEELSLPATTWTDEVGWNNDHLLDLTYTSVLTDDGKPAIAIDFKTLPKVDYVPNSY